MTYRFQLTYPIESHTVHKTNNPKKAIKKCYYDYRYYNGTKNGIFGVTDLNNGNEYHYEVGGSRIRPINKNKLQSGGNKQTTEYALDVTARINGDPPIKLPEQPKQAPRPICSCIPQCSTMIPRCMSTMCNHNPMCNTMPLCSINNYTSCCNHTPSCISVPQCSSPCTHMPPCNNVPCCQKTIIQQKKPIQIQKKPEQKRPAQTDNWCMYL